MPYKEGQPKKRKGNHPLVNDMRRRIKNDPVASGNGCAVVLIAMVAVGVVMVAVGTYGLVMWL